jgi:hypothetical protein
MCRKWFITLNNPITKGFSHEHIKAILSDMKSITYWCMADEISDSGTPHTHIFIYSKVSPIRFSTLQRAFDSKADLEHAKGSVVQCRDYISKPETAVPDMFEEWGDFPQERQGARSDLDDIVNLIENGATNEELRELYPAQYLLYKDKIARVRQEIKEEFYRNEERQVEVTYIYGKTAVGKTFFVLNKHTYGEVCHITTYRNPMIFDKYRNQDIICFDEFDSQIKLQELNGYLDKYPCTLPCRYADKVACYTQVYIISNISLREQYKYEQSSQPDVYAAFTRRIKKVIKFMSDGSRREYDTQDYLNGADIWDKLSDDTPTPFDTPKQREMAGDNHVL